MPKRRAVEIPTLASHWMPPERDGGLGEPVACLASTYTFHASLFENELAPRFLGLKYDRTERETLFVLEREDRLATVTAAVFVDATQVDAGQSTGRWLQIPVVVPRGCQHAKVTLLAWEKLVRVIVASANLTATGYRKNREMAAVFDFFDGEDASARELLGDVVDFFDELVLFSRMPTGTKQRVDDALAGVRRRARSWKNLPQRTERLPSVDFVPVLPGRPGRRARGALVGLAERWGDRRASEITVMTPFIGDSPEAVRTTMHALMEIPRSRDAVGHLAIGGHPSANDEQKVVVDLPIWFRDEWAKAWKTDASQLSVFVIPPHREGEPKATRALHAKAILLESDERTMLLMGSSNFSPHGLGIGAFNIEANLCFGARERDDATRLVNALPVDWDNDVFETLAWPADLNPNAEDAPSSSPPLPPVFVWATYHDREGKLTIGFDRTQPFPASWAIRIPGVDAAVLRSGDVTTPLEDDRVTLTLAADLRSRRITSVVVEWTDDTGAACEARLPTLVADDDELLAPEEFRALTCDGILDCLLSGRDPIEWGESRAGGQKGSGTDAFDPLKAIDTSAYTLYRTRRLGRALAALSRRLLSTLRTTTAMRHRLQRDPIGPVLFAQAMARDAERSNADGRAATVFALTELMLCLAHVGERIDRSGRLGLLQLFREALATIDDLRQRCDPDRATGVDSLATYVDDVRAKCQALVGAAATTVESADAR